MFLDSHIYSECCGCGACADICPVRAISFDHIHNGFTYPQIDYKRCIKCNKCRKICAFTKDYNYDNYFSDRVFYGWVIDRDERMRSTSGGAFYSIAKAFLSKYDNYGACIYGAAWSDPYTVSHIGISEISGLDDLRRSKYIQSSTIHIFEAIKKEIDDRKKVLFSGTPCQIAELYEFLGSRYEEQLLTVDLVCNGVASPIVFKDYIKSLEQKRGNKIVSYSFRNKMPSKNSLKYIEIIYENGKRTFTETDLFYICYQNRLLHRESCFICPYTEFNHLSDITIGDFWHIEEKIESIKDQRPFGISMMLCNTKKGIDCVTELTDIHISEATLDMIDFGEVLNESLRPSKMDEFYMNYKKKKLINELFVYVGFKEILSKRHPYLYSRYRRLRDLINRG